MKLSFGDNISTSSEVIVLLSVEGLLKNLSRTVFEIFNSFARFNVS